jgi:hypothetical protein
MLWGRGGYNSIGKFYGIVELSENKARYINEGRVAMISEPIYYFRNELSASRQTGPIPSS